MLKQLLQFAHRGEEAQKEEDNPVSVELVALATNCEPVMESTPKTTTKSISFDQIYQNAATKPQQAAYGILKVAEMLASPHIASLTPEARRGSVLMALEAAGIQIEDVLQDAILRQRALNDYEETEQLKLREYERAKIQENAETQAELDRLTTEYTSRLQASLDEMAREQHQFHAWQKRKQQESQRITDSASFLVPPGSAVNGAGLTAVLERATGTRR